MKIFSIITSIFCSFFFSSISEAQFFPEVPYVNQALQYEKQWQEINTEHFSIIFPKGMGEFAAYVSPIFEEVHDEMAYLYKQENRHTDVILLPNVDDFNAFAAIPIGSIYIILEQSLNNFTEEIKFAGTMKHTFIHEYSHILQGSVISGLPKVINYFFPWYLPGTFLPGWFLEGWATYVESTKSKTGRVHSSFTDMLIKRDAQDGKLVDIRELNLEYTEIPGGGALVYLYSAKFLDFISQKYGQEKLYELIHYFGRKLTPFFLDYKTKKIFGKSFKDLYAEWKNSMVQKYKKTNDDNSYEKTENFFLAEKVDNLRVHSNGEIYFHDVKDKSIKKLTIDKKIKEVTSLKKIPLYQLFQFEIDGDLLYLVINQETIDGFFSDLFRYSLRTKKLEKLTEKKRIEQIELLGNKMLYVKNELTTRNIYELDLHDFSETRLTNFGYNNHLLSLKVSPDHENSAFVYFDESVGSYNVYVMNLRDKQITQLTNDTNIETDLHWVNNNELLLSINYDNIFNIFHYNLLTKEISQVSEEPLGAFEPQLWENKLYYLTYTNKGYSLKIDDLSLKKTKYRLPMLLNNNQVALDSQKPTSLKEYREGIESYHFLKRTLSSIKLLPYASFESTSNKASSIGVIAAGFDPLFTNIWLLGAGYIPETNDWELNLNYQLNYFYPNIIIGYERWPLLLSDIYFNENNEIIDPNLLYEEKIWAVHTGLKFPIHPSSDISLIYNYEDHEEVRERPEGAQDAFIPGSRRYAGIRANYTLKNYNNTYSTTAYVYNETFLSEFNQERLIFYYKRYHVFSDGYQVNVIKKHFLNWELQGGAAFGEIQRNVFFLGERPIFSELSSGATDVLIYFRGYSLSEISGNRFLKTSLDYTLPLTKHNYGIGYNLFIKKTDLNLFTDFGNAFPSEPNFREFKWSAGPEIKIDFNVFSNALLAMVIGYAYRIRDDDQAYFPYFRLVGRF